MSKPCVHHWVLSAPTSDVVHGRCKRCGARRDYPASVDGVSREGIYGEAASLNKSIAQLPEFEGSSKLAGPRPAW
jgi:hypothetical protein